jgi:P-type conjugative transfer protein TrbJ
MKTSSRTPWHRPLYIWDQAQSTITNLQRATDTLNYYKTQLGSLDNYLAKFQDVSYYRASSCFQRDGLHRRSAGRPGRQLGDDLAGAEEGA